MKLKDTGTFETSLQLYPVVQGIMEVQYGISRLRLQA